ncbi:MAG: hypothetical protein ACT4OP_13805 [Actinomycetota bacterium]
MFWLGRPPYVRRVLAVFIVLIALFFELRPNPTVPRPFAAIDIAAGVWLEQVMIEWREAPPGLLPSFEPTGVALVDLGAGELLSAAVVGHGPIVPPGWWALAVSLPEGTSPGTDVRLVVGRTDPQVVPGVVVRTLSTDGFTGNNGLVALPENAVGLVASAQIDGSLTVLIGGRFNNGSG